MAERDAMSTDVKKEGEAPPPADELKNIKSEMNRKFEAMNAELKKSNEALIAKLSELTKPKPAPQAQQQEEDISDLMYKDPQRFAQRIKQEAKEDIQKELSAREQETVKRTTTINQLYKEFPELALEDSDLTKLALSKYNENVKDTGATPAAYRAAVAEAALELGMKPKSKRAEDDSFQVSGSGGGNRSARKKDGELDSATVAAAQLMGVDPERIKKRQRKNLGRWE